MWTQSDLEQLAQHGISVEKANQQMESFKTGFPSLDIVSAASVKNGILAPKKAEQEEYITAWENYLKGNHKVLKFVPASGRGYVRSSSPASASQLLLMKLRSAPDTSPSPLMSA